jgi:hypothetical protein
MYRKWLIFGVVAILVSISLLPIQAQVAQPINLGSIRVVNALVGMGEVDVYLNARLIETNLTPEIATAYFNVPVGRHTVAVRPAGAAALSIPIADILIDLSANQSQTAIVYQKQFATETFTPNIEQAGAILLVDDNRSPIQLGKTRLTAAHLAPGMPGKLSIAYPSRASLLHEISYEQPYGNIDVEANVYPLTIVDAESESLDRLEQSGELTFNANTYYTLVIVPDIVPQGAPGDPMRVGQLSNTPRLFAISAPLDPPANGVQLRIIHAAYDTAVLDLYIDERLIVPRMNYSQHTEYLPLDSYSHSITLRSRDAAPDTQPYASATFSITEANREQKTWTILLLNANNPNVTTLPAVGSENNQNPTQQIVNLPSSQLIMTLLPDNIAQTQNDTARVRLIHAIDGALEISMSTDALPPLPGIITPTPVSGAPTPTPQPPIPLVEPVVYGVEANEIETRTGLYNELDFLAGSSAEILTLNDQFMAEGMVYTYVLIGLPAGEPPVQALELADFGRGIPRERLYQGRISSNSEVVNVRRQPTNGGGLVGTLPNNAVVEVFGRNNDAQWVYVGYSDSETGAPTQGWVSAALIRVTRLGEQINILSLPVVQA